MPKSSLIFNSVSYKETYMMKLVMQASSMTKSQSMPIRKKLEKEYQVSLYSTGLSFIRSLRGGLLKSWSMNDLLLMYFLGSALTCSMHRMKSLFIILRVASVLSISRLLGMAFSREKNLLDAAYIILSLF